MIINRKYTLPRHFPVKLTQSETLTKYWSIFYGFCKRYRKEWCTLLRHMAIAINQIERKRDINDIPIINCALRARYGVSNSIEPNRNVYQLIESIKLHNNDITILQPPTCVSLRSRSTHRRCWRWSCSSSWSRTLCPHSSWGPSSSPSPWTRASWASSWTYCKDS